MILQLNTNKTITILAQTIPENLSSVRIDYVIPKEYNHLKPVLNWDNDLFIGNGVYINKKFSGNLHDIRVYLKQGNTIVETFIYKGKKPSVYIGFNIETVYPDITTYIKNLEEKNKDLLEKGDII